MIAALQETPDQGQPGAKQLFPLSMRGVAKVSGKPLLLRQAG